MFLLHEALSIRDQAESCQLQTSGALTPQLWSPPGDEAQHLQSLTVLQRQCREGPGKEFGCREGST